MRWWILILITQLWACAPEQASETKIKQKPYFDLKTYFEQKVKEYSAAQPKVNKRVSIGDKQEEIKPDTLDYNQELRVFLDADINKPAWYDKYSIDSVKNSSGQLEKLSYRAKEEDLRVRKIEIQFDKTTVSRIYITNRLHTAVANADQELIFEPGKGYEMINQQQVAYSAAQKLSVEVRWQEK